ncbi:unnamed protein product [Trichogramma brassicae]|uniref:Uncharacterized protein n=1 Tax=Trichogramma brassicae TaxID=86971 RepID=A0A6H5J7E1_9HYME|nr:unnamed protein product [Trichogramma brassicae]
MTTRAARTSLPPQKLMDIPEGAETTPVVLNFSQPSTPDAPIFFPIPLAEGPLNKYILEHNPTSRITPSDYSEYSPSGPQIRIAGNIVASREALTYRSDNYITFVSQDCEPSTRNLRQLSDMDAIDLQAIKARRPALGQAVVSPFKNNNIILLVVKKHHYDPLTAVNVRAAFKCLRDFMTRNKLYSARVARKGCHVKTRDHLLETEEIRESRHSYIYNAETHLNVTELFPQLELGRNFSSILTLNTANTWSKDAVKIETILEKIDAADTKAHEKESTISIIAGGFGTQVILMAGMVALVLYSRKTLPNVPLHRTNSKTKVGRSTEERPSEQEMSEIPRQNVLI